MKPTVLVCALMVVTLSGCADEAPAPVQEAQPVLPRMVDLSPAQLQESTAVLAAQPGEYLMARMVAGPGAWKPADGGVEVFMVATLDGPGDYTFMDGLSWQHGSDYPADLSFDYGSDQTLVGYGAYTTGDDPGSLELAILFGSPNQTVTLKMGLVANFSGSLADTLEQRAKIAVAPDVVVDTMVVGVGRWDRDQTLREMGAITREHTSSTIELPGVVVERHVVVSGNGTATGPGVMSLVHTSQERAAHESFSYEVQAPGLSASGSSTGLRHSLPLLFVGASPFTHRGAAILQGETSGPGDLRVDFERTITGEDVQLLGHVQTVKWGWAPVDLPALYDWVVDRSDQYREFPGVVTRCGGVAQTPC